MTARRIVQLAGARAEFALADDGSIWLWTDVGWKPAGRGPLPSNEEWLSLMMQDAGQANSREAFKKAFPTIVPLAGEKFEPKPASFGDVLAAIHTPGAVNLSPPPPPPISNIFGHTVELAEPEPAKPPYNLRRRGKPTEPSQ